MKNTVKRARDGPALKSASKSAKPGVSLQQMLRAFRQKREPKIRDTEIQKLWQAFKQGADKSRQFTVCNEAGKPAFRFSFVGEGLENVVSGTSNPPRDTDGLWHFPCPKCFAKTPVLHCEWVAKERENGKPVSFMAAIHCGRLYKFAER